MFMCMGVLPVCIPVPHVYSAHRRPEEVGSPGIVVIDSCELPRECWELNPGSFRRAASALNH